jgi:hypothetical protein
VGYCYSSGLEKTLYKWNIYVPLVTKKLNIVLFESPRKGALLLKWEGGEGVVNARIILLFDYS